MEYDAFDAGIELGGLRSRDDIRLLICYLLKSVDAPMTRQMLNDAMQEDGLANFFEVGQAMEELLKTGNITADILDDENSRDTGFATYINEKGVKITENCAGFFVINVPETAARGIKTNGTIIFKALRRSLLLISIIALLLPTVYQTKLGNVPHSNGIGEIPLCHTGCGGRIKAVFGKEFASCTYRNNISPEEKCASVGTHGGKFHVVCNDKNGNAACFEFV